LGGEDFDNNLLVHLKEDIKKKHNKDISSDARAIRRLRTACEKGKRTLSSLTQATIEIDSLIDGIDFTVSITRAKFEELNNKLFKETIDLVDKALEDCGCKKSQVDEVVLVGGSTRIPKVQSLLKEYFNGKKLNKSINPDEAVAYGAAVQAAILTNTMDCEANNLLLLDIAPLSLGVEMQGGVMAVVVPRNTPIPTNKKKIFTTTHDNQTTVEFPVYEGERLMTKDNNLLGEFKLANIFAAPRGTPELECTFDIDANGILKVTAVDKASNNKADITISNATDHLSPSDIERLAKEAKESKEMDTKRKKIIDVRSELENLTYRTRREIEDFNKSMEYTTEQRDRIENALVSAEEALQEDVSKATMSDYQAPLNSLRSSLVCKTRK